MLHYFNPGHESAILNASPYYKPPAVHLKMQEDLSFLPAWYAAKNDAVWVKKELPEAFVTFLEEHFGPMPKIVGKHNAKVYAPFLKGEEVRLWGVSPQAVYYFQQIDECFQLQLQLPVWKDDYRILASRLSAKKCLVYLSAAPEDFTSDLIPRYYTTVEAIEKTIQMIGGNFVVKSPYSSSGRGLLWISDGSLTPSNRRVLQGMLKRQSIVSLEKALNKVFDFSMQFYSDGMGGITFAGFSLFQTDAKGNYKGTSVCSQRKIRYELAKYLQPSLMKRIQHFLLVYLENQYACTYIGDVGVDMMIYEEAGEYRLHPCVEINMRTTMGLLSLHLQKCLTDDQTEAFFHLDFSNEPGEIYRRHLKMTGEYPLQHAKEKIISGYFPLCPVTEESCYWAYVVKSNDWQPGTF